MLSAAGLGARIWDGNEAEEESQFEGVGAWRDFARNPAAGVGLYQDYVGAGSLVEFLLDRREPLALYYHNLTPAELLRRFDPEGARLIELGREELRRLAPRLRLALAASEFSAAELRSHGVRDVRVMPPYGPNLSAEDDPEYERGLRATKRGLDLLFVGRVAPHKGHSLLVQVAALLSAGRDEPVRCFCVGAPGPVPYMFALDRLRDRLGMRDKVIFTGSVSDARLAAHYRVADLFLCLSEHEGFCLPLLEAMRADVPVVAYAVGAVPETMGQAGMLVRTRDPLVIAEVVNRTVTDGPLHDGILARQASRAKEVEGFDRDGVLVRAVQQLLEREPATP
ncbi:MAG: glycosyltransferase family 4 protein [Acidimicrobiaceae bacterium]|nr:glycosyltransferase family 4 protein [Acidimicrobiaceae bacterium]